MLLNYTFYYNLITGQTQWDEPEALQLPPGWVMEIDEQSGNEFYFNDDNNFGQTKTEDIITYNYPPKSQPGLWCQWILDEDIKFCGLQCSRNSLDNALITAPEKRDKNLINKLDVILERLNKK